MRLRKRLVEGGEGERDGLIGRQPTALLPRFDEGLRWADSFFSQQIGVIHDELANSLAKRTFSPVSKTVTGR
jgi:hypothetical protein